MHVKEKLIEYSPWIAYNSGKTATRDRYNA